MENLPQIFLAVVLVVLNGYFVASEFALVAIRRTRIDELVQKKNRRAKLVQSALSDLDSYISATQLGITAASLALGWIGEPAIALTIEPLFAFLPNNIAFLTTHGVAIASAFLLITILHIVFGELIPKSIALARAEKTVLYSIAPLIAFKKVFGPFIAILNSFSSIILKPLHIDPSSIKEAIHSEEEIKMILRESSLSGKIEKGEVEMVINVFKLGDIPVKHIMVPRTDIIAFHTHETIEDVVKKIKKNIHSRFPVFEGSIDTIIGFIHVKDVYKEAVNRSENKKLSQTKLIRDIIHVPETKRADEVLLDMQRKRTHIAIVNDEYGKTEGLVTLEDVFESLVGEISDEFERPIEEIKKRKKIKTLRMRKLKKTK